MAKSKDKRKALQTTAPNKKPKIITPPPDSDGLEPKTLQSIALHQDDVEIAVDTLSTLARNPAVIKSKACKDLRTAVYDFRKACTTGLDVSADANLTARVSGALADGLYTEARVLLAEMRIRNNVPKLGALCRWVRDLDVVSGLAEQLDESAPKRTGNEEDLLVVLDAILRLTGPTDYTMESILLPGPVHPRKDWDLRETRVRRKIYDSVRDRSIFTALPKDLKSKFRILETTPGPQRKPPNLHPAILYTSQNDAILLSSDSPPATHHTHPVVPNLHLLKDVLSPEECTQIIAAGESIGFEPDAPIRAEGEESSILAHNFYWIVDESFIGKLWKRVERFVPPVVDGRKVRGINRRFRVYRYVPGAEYRLHIDGAWPPSGIKKSTNKTTGAVEESYVWDNSPASGKQSSLFTFLIYLNDEFEAGETTFFLPSVREGCMNAYPVKPLQGSVAMFPHGETEGSLLHEGTGVRKTQEPSAKYVIRTDVLYDVEPTEA
ncbi:Hypothetical protein R9X50_00185700 [Acrodontium crateriforme]|uniref:Fe2OG dioxygenase domain-containing protein n=1 Tax=Acrodontium crateriforme TaxID=150365 RepID=A0AAQ3RAE3_9PEZI|nr:Hypothetical protein R9X50_00185700 [Acrodontium crateriforme]